MDIVEAKKSPSVIFHPHALVGDNRQLLYAEYQKGETLEKYLHRHGICKLQNPAVYYNGNRVTFKAWGKIRPKKGSLIEIRGIVPQGGGGDDNKVLNTVLTIAVVVASVYTSGAVGLAYGSAWGAVAQAGVMIAGSLLVNAIAPIGQQTNPTANKNKFETSPTYSISGGRNSLRLWQPLPLVFGVHRVVPDLGAKPFSEWIGNTQYYNQVFNFGLQGGKAAVRDMKIGDTPIENFKGVQVEISGEDGKLSLFPGNVSSIQGFNLSHSDGWISRTTPQDVEHISIELAAQLYRVNDDGSYSNRTVEVIGEYRNISGGEWQPMGASYANYATHYWSLRRETGVVSWAGVETEQVGFGSVNYADHSDGELYKREQIWGFWGSETAYWKVVNTVWKWVPHPYAQGRPWHGIAPDPFISMTDGGIRLTNNSQVPIRRTLSRDVPAGQYEIRIRKVTGDIKDSRESNETAVGQILCYRKDNADYYGQLRVALRIQATEQLQGAVEQFSAVVEPKCDVFRDGEWIESPTRNPAWWFLHLAKGRLAPDGARLYGGGKADSEIDIEGIKAFAAWCDRKKLHYDFVLDGNRSVGEVLEGMARVGRGSVTTQTGKLGVVWEDDAAPFVSVIAPFNIKAGSFQVAYIAKPDVGEIVGSFTNRDTWELDEVRVKIPGSSNSNNPVQIDLEGVTDKDQAGRAANLLAASQVFHRRRVSWEMDMEHMTCKRGDVVIVTHDLTVWGYSGRLVGRDGNRIYVKDAIPSGGSGMMLLRSPDGDCKLVNVSSDADYVDSFVIESDIDDFPLPGDDGYEAVPAIDWGFSFDPQETPGRRMRITSVEPRRDGSAALSAVDDDPEYYASENNPYQYTPRRDGAYLAGVAFGIKISESIVNVLADINQVTATWVLSQSLSVRVSVSVNGNVVRETETSDRTISVQAQTGDDVSIIVTPLSDLGREGSPLSQQYKVLGLMSPLGAVAGLTNVLRDGLTYLVWNRAIDVRNIEYEVRTGDDWANSKTVAITTNTESLTYGSGLYFVAARYARKGEVIYGEPQQIAIFSSSYVRNVIVSRNEHDGWIGQLDGGAIVHENELTLAPTGDFLGVDDVLSLEDVLWHGGASEYGVYHADASNIVDVGYDAQVRVLYDIEEYSINTNEDFLLLDDVLSEDDVLNGSDRQYYDVYPQFRSSHDGIEWTDWQRYVPGTINSRFFDARLVMATKNPYVIPFVRKFTWSIDVPDLIQQGEGLHVPIGGVYVEYAKHFHAVPTVIPAILNAINGDFYVLRDSTTHGFHIEIKNGATSKSAVINWLSQGY